MSADDPTHSDVEGEAAEAQEVEQQEPIYDPAESGPVTAALASRARDLSLAITNPATLARKLRESLIDLVGPEQSRAYHIGASYDSSKGEVQLQIATVTPNFLARLQVERGIGTATGAGSNTGTRAQLEIAYQRTVNGWEVAVGAGLTVEDRLENMGGVEGKDYALGASFSVTVRR